MISSLIKLIKKECGLTQQALADVLGVSLDRVKSITAGKVQQLTREESEALVKKLHVRAEYLVTGQLPLFQTSGEQEFQRRLDAVAQATQQAVAGGLTAEQADVLQRILLASQMGDTATLKQLVISLSRDENELLKNYRRCTPTGRRALLTSSAEMAVAAALAKQEELKAAPSRPGAREFTHSPDRGSRPRGLGEKAQTQTTDKTRTKK